MNYDTFSHHNGSDLIPPEIKQQLLSLVQRLDIKIEPGCSKHLRNTFSAGLLQLGWSKKVRIARVTNISVTSMNRNVALCLQTGNMSRFYADLLKLQYLFKNSKINCAVYVVPKKNCAKIMGSNLAHFERFVSEIVLFKDIITAPIFVIGLC